MTLNLFVSPTKIQMAFDNACAKTTESLMITIPAEGQVADPYARVLGSGTAINLFALNLAALVTGDALSSGGDGFPTVVDTSELIDIFTMIKSAQVVLLGDNFRMDIPVAV